MIDRTENWVQNELTDDHKSWNTRIWYRYWIQDKLAGGHNIWSRNWQGDWVRNKLTSNSIESVGQVVGLRLDRRCRQITFGIDTAACRTVVLARPRHPATRGYRCHRDAEAGVQYSTAGKSVVWDEGRRWLVSKDTEGKLMTIESRQAEVRRPFFDGGFGPDRAFSFKFRDWQSLDGWNLTVELEATHDANSNAIKQMLIGRKDVSSLQPFGWQGTDL